MLDHYIDVFSKLNRAPGIVWTDATKRRAPHKAFLLLALIDLFSRNAIKENFIELSQDLIDLFLIYWNRVVPLGQKSNIALPFFHLKSEGFWHLIPVPGKEETLLSATRCDNIPQLRKLAIGAKLDDELYTVFQAEKNRRILRDVIIHSCFSEECQKIVWQQCAINDESFTYSEELIEKSHQEFILEHPEESNYKPEVRDPGFRQAVVKTYNHRCSLCGVRIITLEGHTAVEAAHIIPWRLTHNDDIRNGMALCKLCHWGFDEGVVGVSERYEVITSNLISSENNFPGFIANLSGRQIVGPDDRTLWPAQESLSWHRKEFRLG